METCGDVPLVDLVAERAVGNFPARQQVAVRVNEGGEPLAPAHGASGQQAGGP